MWITVRVSLLPRYIHRIRRGALRPPRHRIRHIREGDDTQHDDDENDEFFAAVHIPSVYGMSAAAVCGGRLRRYRCRTRRPALRGMRGGGRQSVGFIPACVTARFTAGGTPGGSAPRATVRDNPADPSSHPSRRPAPAVRGSARRRISAHTARPVCRLNRTRHSAGGDRC